MDDLLLRSHLSRTTVDRLGDAMRQRDLDEQEIATFDRYREAFRPALDDVLAKVREVYPGEITERQKTIVSTVAKLRRESVRLSQVQDIAGCRAIVRSLREQDAITNTLLNSHADWRLEDRRRKPTHGYRAAHIIAFSGGLRVEVQIRTQLQHAWAELSEAWDRLHEGVKYGRGPEDIHRYLGTISRGIGRFESAESEMQELLDALPEGIDDAWPQVFPDLRREATGPMIEALEEVGSEPGGLARLAEYSVRWRERMRDELLAHVKQSFPR
jgi:ppGpp synthetase/RelA/SpoT-type nucleotidyltranferase